MQAIDVSTARMVPEHTLSESDLHAHRKRDQRPREMLLDCELGPPAGTMARQQHGGIEAFQVLDGAFQLAVFAGGQMEPSQDCMDGHRARVSARKGVTCILGGVNQSCMAAASKEHDTLV